MENEMAQIRILAFSLSLALSLSLSLSLSFLCMCGNVTNVCSFYILHIVAKSPSAFPK